MANKTKTLTRRLPIELHNKMQVYVSVCSGELSAKRRTRIKQHTSALHACWVSNGLCSTRATTTNNMNSNIHYHVWY